MHGVFAKENMTIKPNRPPFDDGVAGENKMSREWQNYHVSLNDSVEDIVQNGVNLPSATTAQIAERAVRPRTVGRIFVNSETGKLQFSADGDTVQTITSA